MDNLKLSSVLSTDEILKETFQTILSNLSCDDASKSKREQAFSSFEEIGLPSKKVERWHYTDLARLLKDLPKFSLSDKSELYQSAALFNDSYLASNIADSSSLDKIDIVKLADFTSKESSNNSSLVETDHDVITHLNTAFTNNIWMVNIAPEVKLDEAIEFAYRLDADNQNHITHEINISENAELFFVEKYEQGKTEASSNFTTACTRITVADNAKVSWLILHESEYNQQLSRFEAKLGKNSKLTLFFFNIKNNGLIRQDVAVKLEGEGGDFNLRALNLLSGTSHSDLTMEVSHIAPNTTSDELVRNVVADKANGNFQGVIKVAREAQKTDAQMRCNCLLLSDNAQFNSKPELEIFADDVSCGHGATVAEINKNHLFYLMARGIPRDIASSLLIKSFVAEILDDLPKDNQKDVLLEKIDSWLLENFKDI